MILAFLLCLLSFAIASASDNNDDNNKIINISAPSSVKVDENVVLLCNYILENVPQEKIAFKWWFTPDEDPSKKAQLYQRIGNNNATNLRPNRIVLKEKDAIEILDVQTSDTGTYLCDVSEDLGFAEIKAPHHLTVYTPGTGPQLNLTKTENETGVLVTCRADGVAPYPELVISIFGEEVPANDSTVEYNSESKDWNIEANITTVDETDSFEARCELFFQDKNVTHEPYVETITYNGSGVESTTEGEVVTTEETDTTPVPTGGSVLRHISWLALLAAPLQLALVSL